MIPGSKLYGERLLPAIDSDTKGLYTTPRAWIQIRNNDKVSYEKQKMKKNEKKSFLLGG
jgi:hypothetical protein